MPQYLGAKKEKTLTKRAGLSGLFIFLLHGARIGDTTNAKLILSRSILMGIRETLAAAALSVTVFSSTAEAQSSIRPQPAGHCLDNMLNTRIVAEDLFNTPIDEWKDSFLSSIGPQNIFALLGWIGSFEVTIARQIKETGSDIHNFGKESKGYRLNWDVLKGKTHFALHEVLEKVRKEKLGINEWDDLAKKARDNHVKAIREKLDSVKYGSKSDFCPTMLK